MRSADGSYWIVAKTWQPVPVPRQTKATGKAPRLLTMDKVIAQLPGAVPHEERLDKMSALQRARALYGKAVHPLTLAQAKALVGPFKPFVVLAGQEWEDGGMMGMAQRGRLVSLWTIVAIDADNVLEIRESKGQTWAAAGRGGRIVQGTGSDPVYVFRA